MFRRLSVVLASVAVLGFAFAPAASAAPPDKQTFSDSGTFQLEDCGGGVTLDETFTQIATVTTYLDGSGNPIRFELHVHFLGIITNSASGNTYRDPEDFASGMDLSGVTSYNGLVFQIIVHGQGPVIQDTGKVTFDGHGNITFEAGPHMVADGTAPDPCSVLV